jgi:general secretion pathway protein H
LNEVFAPVSVRKSSGFTLLELLVALVLIGIILSFAVFTVDSGEDRRIREEANRFFYLLKLAQEEAILNASEWVLEIDEQGYTFSVLTQEGAQPLIDPVFRQRKFADYVRPVVQFEQNQLVLNAEEKEDASASRIYILSSGELTPFQIRFPASDKNFEIKGSMQGDITMQNVDRDVK